MEKEYSVCSQLIYMMQVLCEKQNRRKRPPAKGFKGRQGKVFDKKIQARDIAI